ncbi:hypothetical protein CHU92_09900 [Flavobacterium cyanobacteriorum]|uniref:Outer membrane protein beta-barrel domain-containing protein n=1 Tax=Flavobacterium cyanobacteriorum TaxID=2022802 RepID=A0A255Z5Y1_9FLAO|nr:porin family protein [Flavobacterium cyanobacteriorum]OYQ36324.1 hypothetical protein CHU92_09900 [Flavobacterium cyanobacteriorum]
MKKIFLAFAFAAVSFGVQAQGIDFGLKAGANFANLNGADNTENITSFHAGAALELNLVPSFSIQGEALYSSQGAEVKGVGDFNLDYIAVPVMAKFYILPDKLSVMAGPQFSFLVDEAEEAFENKTFDIAAAGGLELKIIKGLFAQARYTIGFNDVNDTFEGKNAVFQLSLGYYFL